MSRESQELERLNMGTRYRHRQQVEAMVQLARHLVTGRGVRGTPGLVVLLNEFAKFAEEYAATLGAANTEGNLAFLLDAGIVRLLQEWSILSRACEQRNEPSPNSQRVSDRQKNVRYYLAEADQRLRSYCQRWQYAGPVSPTYLKLETPIVYFEKLYFISRALFAPQIPVVSIPLSDYDNPDGWLALAHEMGHHIFWNAIDLEKFGGVQRQMRAVVANALLTNLDVSDANNASASVYRRLALWSSWLEEVFADVCGVLFAGPAFALSAQELAVASVGKLDDLIGEHDKRHPGPYLRPLIALQVVREVAVASPRSDYSQKLLAWAGSGEAETQRRALAYEDELRARQAAQTQSGTRAKRLPAEFDVSSEVLKSLDIRWTRFTAPVATKTHPTLGITLEELARDVRVVVRALLYSPCWPGERRLWDLVDYHGRQPTDSDIQNLDNLKWSQLPNIPSILSFPPIPNLAINPQSDFQRVLNRIIRGVVEADLEETEKPRIFWTLLAAMDVQADAAGYPPHDWASDHSHEVLGISVTLRHTHGPDGLYIEWDFSAII